MKAAATAVAIFITFLFLLVNVVGVLFGAGWTIFSSEVHGATDKYALHGRVRSKVYQADNAVANYESFYNDCRSVMAMNTQIASMQTDLKSRLESYNPTVDKFGNVQQEISDLRSQITGVQSQQAQTAQGYNARSSAQTSNVFKAADLPYTIDPPYSNVSCGQPTAAGDNHFTN